MRLKKTMVAVAALAVITGVTAGAALTQSTAARHGAAAGSDIETLNWGLTSGPRSLDLAHSMDINTLSVLSLGLESLLRIDQHGKIVPNLAVSWKQPNKLTYVFNLRRGRCEVASTQSNLMADDDVVSDPRALVNNNSQRVGQKHRFR